MCVSESNEEEESENTFELSSSRSPPRSPIKGIDRWIPTGDQDGVFATLHQLSEKVIGRQENRTLYFCRHGESTYNVEERIGGNPDLSDKGKRFAKALGAYVNDLG